MKNNIGNEKVTTERNTFQKQIILDVLNNSTMHPTAEDIYNEIHVNYPTISKATIYRNLKAMADKGIIRRIEIADVNIHYDKDSSHYHKKCIKCNKIADLDIPYKSELDYLIDEPVLGHDIIFKYICSDCKN